MTFTKKSSVGPGVWDVCNNCNRNTLYWRAVFNTYSG